MEPRGSMLHSQGFFNNPYSDSNNPITQFDIVSLRLILILSSHLSQHFPKGLFPVCLPVKILNALLPSFIQGTWPPYLNILDLITLTMLGEWYKLWSSLLWSLLHSPFAFPLGSNIHLTIIFKYCISLLMSETMFYNPTAQLAI